MSQASTRTYDDLPEADVATVLEVPLLWGGKGAVSTTPGRAASPTRGRRQPATSGRGAHASGRVSAASTTQSPGRHRAVADVRAKSSHTLEQWMEWRRHPVVHTVEVGLISAALVLGVLGVVLLALALWLP